MSIDIVFIVIAIVVMGILFHALTPRGLDHFQDTFRLPLVREHPGGNDREWRLPPRPPKARMRYAMLMRRKAAGLNGPENAIADTLPRRGR
jgi:hypothetical protein